MPPTLVLHLHCEPETAYERVQQRGREAEEKLSLDYLVSLDAAYQDLWVEMDRGLLPWGHRVRREIIHWDPIADMPNWDRHAKALARECGIPYSPAASETVPPSVTVSEELSVTARSVEASADASS
jgi:hypothetical protein